MAAGKREIFKEISEKCKRSSGFDSVNRYEKFVARFQSIEKCHDDIIEKIDSKEVIEEFERYIPVALVALLESYFRDIVGFLVDKGEPYSERIESLIDQKFSISQLSQIQNGHATTGQVAAHTIKLSSPAAINSAMSKLINKNFFGFMSEVDVSCEPFNFDCPGLLGFDGSFFGSMEKLYDMRNVYCHEYGNNYRDPKKLTYIHCMLLIPYFVVSTEIVVRTLARKPKAIEQYLNAYAN